MQHGNIIRSGIQNIVWAVVANATTAAVSILLGFVLPRLLGASEFGYWQVYLFYTGYVMLLGAGFNDGLYLRYGHLDYARLPFEKLRGAMRVFIGMEVALSVVLLILSCHAADASKRFCFQMVSCNLFLLSVGGTLLTVLQLTNRIKENSVFLVAQKILMGVGVIGLLLCHSLRFQNIIWIDIAVKTLLLVINMILLRDLFYGRSSSWTEGVREYFANIRVGSHLMLAVLAGSFLIGMGRMLVERYMSIEIYGIYSFATAILGFSLIFFAAVSVALYPLLKRLEESQLLALYLRINQSLCLIVFSGMWFFFPLCFLIRRQFVPFVGVLDYLYMFFVIIFVQAKLLLLLTTYYKVLREERALFRANLIALFWTGIFIIPAFYFYRSIYPVVIGTMCAAILRCYLSEIFIKRKLRMPHCWLPIVRELLLMGVFCFCSTLFSVGVGAVLYALFILGYLWKNRAAILVASYGVYNYLSKKYA